MPDRAHHGGARGRHCTHQGLVAERQQVFHAAATARDHDHIDMRVGVEFGQCSGDLGHGVDSLDRDLADFEPGPGPPFLDVDEYVGHCSTRASADQTDRVRQEG